MISYPGYILSYLYSFTTPVSLKKYPWSQYNLWNILSLIRIPDIFYNINLSFQLYWNYQLLSHFRMINFPRYVSPTHPRFSMKTPNVRLPDGVNRREVTWLTIYHAPLAFNWFRVRFAIQKAATMGPSTLEQFVANFKWIRLVLELTLVTRIPEVSSLGFTDPELFDFLYFVCAF